LWSQCLSCNGQQKRFRSRIAAPDNKALPKICTLLQERFCFCPYADPTLVTRDASLSFLNRIFITDDANNAHNNDPDNATATKRNTLQFNDPTTRVTKPTNGTPAATWLQDDYDVKLFVNLNVNDGLMVYYESPSSCDAETQRNLTDRLESTSHYALPSVSPSRIYVSSGSVAGTPTTCYSTIKIDPDDSFPIGAVVGPVLGALFLIILLLVVYKLLSKKDNQNLVPKLPPEFHPIFKDYKNWRKTGNLYSKTLDEDTDEMQLFKALWSSLCSAEMKFKAVHTLWNPVLASSFINFQDILAQRYIESPHLFKKQKWRNKQHFKAEREFVHDQLERRISEFSWNVVKGLDGEETFYVDVPIIPVAHGTSTTVGWSIAVQGFAALASLDAGYYGKGIYFTSYVEYTIQYFLTKPDPAVLVTLVIPGNAYPVIEHPKELQENLTSLVGLPLNSGYQSHFVLTRMNGLPWNKDGSDEEGGRREALDDTQELPQKKKKKKNTFFEFGAVEKRDRAGTFLAQPSAVAPAPVVKTWYDELVINQEAQSLPIYLAEIDSGMEHVRHLKSLVSKRKLNAKLVATDASQSKGPTTTKSKGTKESKSSKGTKEKL